MRDKNSTYLAGLLGRVKEDNPLKELRTSWYLIGAQGTLANIILFVFGISIYPILNLPAPPLLHTSGTQVTYPSH